MRQMGVEIARALEVDAEVSSEGGDPDGPLGEAVDACRGDAAPTDEVTRV